MGLLRNYKKLWSMQTKAFFAAICLVIGQSTPLIAQIMHVSAESDTTPLVLNSITASTNAINVNAAAVEVDLTGAVTDDLSGFAYTKFYYTSPSGMQVVEGEMTAFSTTSFGARAIFPRYAEAGTWVPTMTFSDLSGNISDYTASELAGLGFTLGVAVTSTTPDTAAPVLTAMVQDRSNIDTDLSNDQNTVTADISDNLSGFYKATIKFTSPSGNVTSVANFETTIDPGIYAATPVFNAHTETGHWDAEVTVTDNAFNVHIYDTADLNGLGFPSGVDVTGSPDTTPVSVDNLEFAPVGDEAPEVPIAGASFMVRGAMSDNLSGITAVSLIYHSTTSNQIANHNTLIIGGDPNTADWNFYVQTPPYAAEGAWQPELVTSDAAGNNHTYSHADLLLLGYDLSVVIGQNVSDNVGNGGTVTSDTGGTGATPTVPVQAAVTTPVAGDVSVVRLDTTDSEIEFGGYSFFAEQFNISAPAATVSSPLVFKFTVDASKLGGLTADDVQIFRDGVVIEDCLGSSIADPDPCVKSRTTLGSGDVEVTVNSSHASNWMIGYEVAPSGSFHFQKFKKPIKQAPALNKDKAGSTISIKFSVGGDYGLNILANGSPSTQKINCETKQPVGDPLETVSSNDKELKFTGNGFYRYNWKTLKKWNGTCRKFVLTFTNGETATAYFKFNQ